ncbi:hypothetical protein FG386_001498 [Cryptosporidium ryanae]|uniref:uncharacterized protein n=1 Tax=Cryptosporidium ryanae TaxID=515981 RepID=UPI00351A2324|nr:hypothetical protein FG386_001498 [Cryptosporidium ryanae]
MRFTPFILSSLLFGLLSVAYSSNLRAAVDSDLIGSESEIFNGQPIRKVEVRSPISGILNKVNILSTGYHSAGTAFVVTATENQYYKSSITTSGKSVSVKRIVEAGRNVYIQIFREFYVTFFTSKNPGDSVQQFDLLAILFVKRTLPGESPILQKLPRSVPTSPIVASLPSVSSKSENEAEESDLYIPSSSHETELTDVGGSLSSAEESPQKQELDRQIDGASGGTLSSDSSKFEESQEDQVSLVESQMRSDQVSVDDSQLSDSLEENQGLDQIPNKSNIISSDISDSEELGEAMQRSFSEVSDFVSDSEESSRSSGALSNSENNVQSIQPGDLVGSTTDVLSDENYRNNGVNFDEQGIPLKTQTTLIDISGESMIDPDKKDQYTQTESFDPTAAAVQEAMSITSLSTSIPVEDKSVESESENSSEVESPEANSPEANSPEANSPEANSPEVESPEVESPEVESPEVESPEAESPEVESPEAESPEVESPEVESSEVESPEAESISSAQDSEKSDAVVTVVTESTSESISSPIPESENEEVPEIPDKPIVETKIEDEHKGDEFDEMDTNSSAGGDNSANSGNEGNSLSSAGRYIGSDVDNSGSANE